MKLSLSSPIVVLIGPLRPIRRTVTVADVGPKDPPKIEIELGGKRAYRARRIRVGPARDRDAEA